jgi:hypothetical protein
MDSLEEKLPTSGSYPPSCQELPQLERYPPSSHLRKTNFKTF